MSISTLFTEKNVGQRDRLLSVLVGLFLVFASFGFSFSKLMTIIVLILGISLVARAVTGSCLVYSLLGKNSCETK